MIPDISALHSEYRKSKLSEGELHENPIYQFEKWLSDAIDAKVKEPTAMTLATVNENNQPSARIVLLKFVNEKGLAFFTNYQSRKGNELNKNPKAALVFFWTELERQVRVEGKVSKLSRKISNEYFNLRPKESRISAIISPQSQPIPNRQFLENRVAEFLKNNNEIITPENWGGYILTPRTFEFWQGRENRLHDRFLYKKIGKRWKISRLAP